jgi:hypothetical protein
MKRLAVVLMLLSVCIFSLPLVGCGGGQENTSGQPGTDVSSPETSPEESGEEAAHEEGEEPEAPLPME